MVRKTFVYWGPTRTGKTRKAWEEAGADAFVKDPNTKWWDGYRGQENVIIDEFRGLINISHMLRWLDRYPVIYEFKGGAIASNVKNFWITSNLDPRSWYGSEDMATQEALFARIEIKKFPI